MSATTDREHTLIISEPGDGLEPKREWRVVHPPTCPWEAYDLDRSILWDDPLRGERRFDFHRVCLTQYEIDNIGLDGLEDWEKLPVGKHKIVVESIYYPGEFGGTWGEEWDVVMNLVEA